MFHFTRDMYFNIFNSSINLNRVLDIKNILNFAPMSCEAPTVCPSSVKC